MAQLLNLAANLGASKTGLAIGYVLLNLDGTTQAAFTTTNVVEMSVPGRYVVTVPVSVADAGARIGWGISGTIYEWGIIDPVPSVNLTVAAISANTAPILTAIDALSVVPLAAVERPYVVNDLVVVRASTFIATVSVPSIPSDWTALRFTMKEPDQEKDDDSTSVLQILVSNPGAGGDGLQVLNGNAALASDAALTVDTVEKQIAVRIEDDATALLYPSNYPYDLKFYHGSSESGLPYEGRVRVLALPTQTI